MDNKTTPKVSVIIPIYKAEKFIERCCQSLFEQTLDEMEYIFVDDCSPDNSVTMIRELVKKYPNREHQVKILFHTPNRGVSYTRQQGLDAATGEYVTHCDSDDWIDIEAYEVAYKTAISQKADIIRFGHIVEYSDGRKIKNVFERENFFEPLIFNISPQTGSVCGALIHTCLLKDNKINFPINTNWGEDFCVSISSLIFSKKTICLQDCFYHYWQNTDSITHTISKEKCLELIKVAENVEELLVKHNKIKEFAFQLNYLKFQCKAPLLLFDNIRDFELWRSIYPECHEEIMSYEFPLYFRIACELITLRLSWIAKLLFILRTYYNNCRR